MNTLLNHLRTQSTAPLAHTFIIGAGDGSQLTHWRELSSEQLHLAEAHPAHAKTLQQHTQGQPQEHLYPGAITADTQETATLHLLTLPKFSSLNAPSGLSQQLPNISVQGTETVPAQPITAWLTQTELDPNATHTLVINAPGQAHALLNATPNALLHAFTWIMVNTADEALYENDVDSATLETALTQRGYARVAEDDATYPTVERLYQRQPSVIERLTLTAERDALAKQLEEARANAKSETEKLAKELEEARVIARRETTKQSQALEAAQRQLAERDQQLEKARNTAKQHEEACATAKSEAEKLAKELEEARVIARRETAKQSQALEAAQKQLAERDQQLEKARNTAKQHEEACATAKSEATKQSQALKDTEAALATAKSEAEKLAKELEESRVIAKSEATKQSQALEAAQKQLAERGQQLEEAKQQIETLTQQLATKENSLTKTEERFSSLESKLDQLFGEQRSYIQQTTNALGQHVTRSAQQQRDEQALTHYLHHGQRPISTELPPNFAMALLERRETQRYDVMVVLGSTPVTELLAQAVVNETRQQPRLTAQHANESGKDVQHYVAPSQDDLPQAVISLAHKKSLCKTLKQRLAANHTQEAVNVVHAPWVEANEKGDLFYAWEATLKRLNQWLEEDAKVLVVVGNALAEANHPRMAALPPLLQHLPTQTLEVIVEGNHYPQESDLKAEWEALLSKREREAETLRLPTALGLRISG